MIGAEQFDRMAEADALGLHYPVDYRAAGLAGAETVPQVLLRTDNQRRVVIVVERAQPEQVRAVPAEFDSPRFDKPLETHLPLEPLDFLVGDARHSVIS